MSDRFQQLRQATLAKLDRSPKGSIDDAALPILNLVNALPDWFSTSCCSGRISVYAPQATAIHGDDEVDDDMFESTLNSKTVKKVVNGKGNGGWLYVSHSPLPLQASQDPINTLFGSLPVTNDAATETLEGSLVHFKYEAPVFHFCARSLDVALRLQQASLSAGFRNSGLLVSKTGRITLAIRTSPGGLDVPIAKSCKNQCSFKLLVPETYLVQLVELGNTLMKRNEQRLERLKEEIEKVLSTEHVLVKEFETQEDRTIRMRGEGLALQKQKQSNQGSTSRVEHDNDDDVNLSILY